MPSTDHSLREGLPRSAPRRLLRPVALVGMMGCGKTAVGTALAARLVVPFRDTDAALEQAARMTVPEIFARDGEPFFRRRESEVLRRLLSEGPAVISTGGGAFLRPENRAAIDAAGLSVWLSVPEPVLWDRVKGRTHRPLLNTEDPRGTLGRLLSDRLPDYARAGRTVSAEADTSINAMVDRVVAALSDAGALG
jgi:shikimate kinase